MPTLREHFTDDELERIADALCPDSPRPASGLWYLACPYSHACASIRQMRHDDVTQVAAAFLKAGVLVFSPISHTHYMAKHELPDGWDFWERLDREFVNVCRGLIVVQLAGWSQSVGVAAETRIAREQGKPIYYLDPHRPEDFDAVVEAVKQHH